MKKTISVLLALCLTLTSLCGINVFATGKTAEKTVVAENVNLFKNGDFENTTIEPPSKANVIKNTDGGWYQSDYVHSGAHSLELKSNGNTSTFDSTTHFQTLEKNTKYVLSAWIKRATTGGPDWDCSIYMKVDENKNGSKVKESWIGKSAHFKSSEFIQYTAVFTTGSDFDSTNITVYAPTADVQFYIDDIELYKVSDFTPKVTATTIANNEQNVVIDKVLNYEFNCPVDAATYENVYINDVVSVKNDIVVNINDGDIGQRGHEKTFISVKPKLTPNTDYKITLKNLKMATGQILPDYDINFKTIKTPRENIVVNGDNEDYWTEITANANCYSRIFKSSGLFSTRVTSRWTHGDTDAIKLDGLKSNTLYDYSLKVAVGPNTTNKQMVFLTRFWYEGATDLTQSWIADKTISSSDGFVEFAGTFTTSNTALNAAKTQAIAIVSKDSGVTYYFDDLVITPHIEPFDVESQLTIGDSQTPAEILTSGVVKSANIIVNNTDNPITVKNMLAYYDRDGKLKNVVQSDNVTVEGVTVNGAEVTPGMGAVSTSVTADVKGEGESVKSFIWETATLKPICKAKTLSNKRKILFLGNSITRHAPKADIGWYGNYGMAASAEDKDYVHQLMQMINKDYRLDFHVQNIADVEGDHKNLSDLHLRSDIKESIDFNPDIIVVSLGANVKANIVDFNTSYKNIIDLFSNGKSPKIIVVSTVLTGNDVLAEIEEMTTANHYPLVKTGDLGDFDKYLATGLFENIGVQIHPGDLGMYTMAERIFPEVKKILDAK